MLEPPVSLRACATRLPCRAATGYSGSLVRRHLDSASVPALDSAGAHCGRMRIWFFQWANMDRFVLGIHVQPTASPLSNVCGWL